jgi:hypothetical protein
MQAVAGGAIDRSTAFRTVNLKISLLSTQKNLVLIYPNYVAVIGPGRFEPKGARMKTNITFSDAVDGYLLAVTARHLSQHTIADYVNTFRKFLGFYPEDPLFASITARSLEVGSGGAIAVVQGAAEGIAMQAGAGFFSQVAQSDSGADAFFEGLGEGIRGSNPKGQPVHITERFLQAMVNSYCDNKFLG